MRSYVQHINPVVAKILRLVLVFSLVFWSSLGVEWAIAFGADGSQSSNSVQAEKSDDADAKAAQAVIDLIDKLPSSPTADDEDVVKKAEDAYKELTSAQKKLVTNHDKLESAREAVDADKAARAAEQAAAEKAAADAAAAQAVIDQISALGSPDSATADDEAAANAALAAYESLTADQKALVTNYGTLTAFIEAVNAAKQAAADQAADAAAAQAVIDQISALGSPDSATAADQAAADAALAAYEKLTADQKALVTNYPDLVAFLAAIPGGEDPVSAADRTAAEAVDRMIADLPTSEDDVTADHVEACAKIRAAYDALSDAAKALIQPEALAKLDLVEAAAKAKAGDEADDGKTDESKRFKAAEHEDGTLEDVEVWSMDKADPTKAGAVVTSATATAKEDSYNKPEIAAGDEGLVLFAVPKWATDTNMTEQEQKDWKPAVEAADFLEWSVEGEGDCVELKAEGGKVTVTGKAAGTATLVCKIVKDDEKKLDYTGLVSNAFKEAYKDEIGNPKEMVVRVEVTVTEEEADEPYLTIELLDAQGKTLAGIDPQLDLTDEQLKSYKFTARVHIHTPPAEETEDLDVSSAQDLDIKSSGRYKELVWEVLTLSEEAVPKEVAEISPEGIFSLKGNIVQDGPFIVRVSAPSDGFNHTPASFDVKLVREGADVVPMEDPQGDVTNRQDNLHITSNARVAAPAAEGDSAADAGGSAASPSASAVSASASSASAGSASAAAAEGGEGEGGEEEQPAVTVEPVDVTFTDADLRALSLLPDLTEGEKAALAVKTGTFTMKSGEETRAVDGEGIDLKALLDYVGIKDVTQIETIEFKDYRGVSTNVTWSELVGSSGSAMVALKSHVHVEGERANAGGNNNANNTPDANANANANSNGSVTTQADEGQSSGASQPAASSNASADAQDPTASSDASAPAAEASGSAASPAPSDAAQPSSGSASSTSSPSATPADQGQGGQESSSNLVDNTRFRVLYSSGTPTIDADNLRWVNEINVVVKTAAEADDDPEEDETLKVRVDYVPVPLGDTAVLSAIPNQEIGGARFGFRWQESTDGEKWTDVSNGSVQTLRVVTDQGHLGRYYRVILETDLPKPKQETEEGEEAEGQETEYRTATSDPVQITEGSGFTVVLAYDPPVAGDTAIFQSSLKATVGGQVIKIDPKDVQYVWEQSNDGGATWSVIKGATGATFSVPTEPIDETAEADPNAEPVQLIYIRVRAITTDSRIPEANRVAVSNAQPLTVRVGGGDDPNGGTDAGEVVEEKKSDGSSDKLPDENQKDNEKKVTEIKNIKTENEPRPSKPTTSGRTPSETPTPEDPDIDPEPEEDIEEFEPEEVSENAEKAVDNLVINPQVTSLILDQKEAVDEALSEARPGARWTELSTVEPTPDDVRRILADNPFAPFAIPMGLGIAVAGGLEKFLTFRRQKR